MNDNYLDITDEKGNIIGKDTWSNLHRDPKRIHRAVDILIFNSKKELLLQQRALHKRFGAGVWGVSVAGHVNLGEEPDRAAIREIKEEIGVDVDGVEYITKKIFVRKNESELTYLYKAQSEGLFTVDKSEVEQVKFVEVSEIQKYMKMNKERSHFEDWIPTIKNMFK
jgi:isopentenyl-diphosphate delta-isomerase type 1